MKRLTKISFCVLMVLALVLPNRQHGGQATSSADNPANGATGSTKSTTSLAAQTETTAKPAPKNNVIKLSSIAAHFLALKEDGSLWGFGYDTSGVLSEKTVQHDEPKQLMAQGVKRSPPATVISWP